jgi:hypothetical protein
MLLTRITMLLRWSMSPADAKLVREFREAWSCESAHRVEAVMSSLLSSTGARAVGWWRRVGEELEQLSFQAAADMPEEVHIGFMEATGRVSMSRIELGCVRAAAELQLVIAREDAAQRGLTGSASWLARFGASQSLALPIVRDGRAVGVLAVATAAVFDEDSPIWRLMAAIVAELVSVPYRDR